ncbi:metallophosphoesterase family protein [uncultured Sulfitobacter sp.]|uniref:metallophosphoesterase family protein n=1 Tax=uncultured Sulfitobacter sp. TaxID=191468 RepID=UPI00261CF375|nr:metallophosphoesterase family protein [uncultured Sulfitobacter sp.]
MKHRDLGDLDGDIVLFGGPYSNVQALEALFEWARDAGVTPDRMICTGDVVGYCGAAAACVEAVRASGCTLVAGNCEIQLATDAADCGCGFSEGSVCDTLSSAWFTHARSELNADQKAWLGGAHDVVTFNHGAKRYAVLHGGSTDVSRFIWESDEEALFVREWAALEKHTGPVDSIVAGHGGLPFLRLTARGPWINTGVIGIPPNDGAPQTRFGFLSGGQLRIEHLTYDVDAAMRDMSDAGLPEACRTALKSGYWPSQDHLPESLRVAEADKG